MAGQSVSQTSINNAIKHQQKHTVNVMKCAAKVQQLCSDVWQERNGEEVVQCACSTRLCWAHTMQNTLPVVRGDL